jgi:hypothetical protein
MLHMDLLCYFTDIPTVQRLVEEICTIKHTTHTSNTYEIIEMIQVASSHQCSLCTIHYSESLDPQKHLLCNTTNIPILQRLIKSWGIIKHIVHPEEKMSRNKRGETQKGYRYCVGSSLAYVVTWLTFQLSNGWLKELAPPNINSMLVIPISHK